MNINDFKFRGKIILIPYTVERINFKTLINEFILELNCIHIWIDDKLYLFQDEFVLTNGISQDEHFVLLTDNTNSHKFFSTTSNIKFDNIGELRKVILDIKHNGSKEYIIKEDTSTL